jgi:origin recognition complex subunit 5
LKALDHAELLRNFPQTLLPALMRLGELIERPVGLVLISHLIWEKFRVPVGFPGDPVTISFSPYTNEEMQEILCQRLLPTFQPLLKQAVDCGIAGMDERKFRLLFQELFNLVFMTINRASRILSDYARLMTALFPLYIEPILRGEVQSDGVRQLAAKIQPIMRSSLNKLYMGDISDLSASKGRLRRISLSAQPLIDYQFIGHRKVLQLPRFTKFLLIAGFLASYNPAKFDVRFFAKITETKKVKGGRRRTVRNAQGKNERVSDGSCCLRNR